MQLYSIASGSSGNCIYVGSDTTHLLVDTGISMKRTEEGLNAIDISLRDMDGILITHEHSDHLDSSAIIALSNEATLLIANENSVKRLGRGCVMRNGEIRILSDVISVEAVPAYNTSAEKQKYHPQGRDNGYVLDIDGLRIYIAGDTEPIPEMSRIRDIDIAFLPVNHPYTKTPEQAAVAARSFMPKVLYPYHYGETKIEQVAEALSGSGIEVRIRNYK